MTRPLIEICVEGVDGAVAAQEGGGDRAELCASLLEGGLTPSHGTVRATLDAVRIRTHVMVRPRGGDFLYSPREHASMLTDAALFRDMGVPAVVVGYLTADGAVDEARTRAFVEAAAPASVTFHRAFDMAADPEAALETLIRCGVQRVLTSGQQPTGLAGIPLLKRLHARAAGRIIILGCGALGPDSIARVWRETGVGELHFSAPRTEPSPMRYRKPALAMGGVPAEREYERTVTDPALVRATIAALGA